MIENNIDYTDNFIYPKKDADNLKHLVKLCFERNLCFFDDFAEKHRLTKRLISILKIASKSEIKLLTSTQFYDYKKPTLIIPYTCDNSKNNKYMNGIKTGKDSKYISRVRIVSSETMNELDDFYKNKLKGSVACRNLYPENDSHAVLHERKICLYIDEKVAIMACI